MTCPSNKIIAMAMSLMMTLSAFAKNDLPEWINEPTGSDSWMGISFAGLSHDEAQACAVANAWLYYALSVGAGQSQTGLTQDLKSNNGSGQDKMSYENYVAFTRTSIFIDKQYYNDEGECFVLCRIYDDPAGSNKGCINRRDEYVNKSEQSPQTSVAVIYEAITSFGPANITMSQQYTGHKLSESILAFNGTACPKENLGTRQFRELMKMTPVSSDFAYHSLSDYTQIIYDSQNSEENFKLVSQIFNSKRFMPWNIKLSKFTSKGFDMAFGKEKASLDINPDFITTIYPDELNSTDSDAINFIMRLVNGANELMTKNGEAILSQKESSKVATEFSSLQSDDQVVSQSITQLNFTLKNIYSLTSSQGEMPIPVFSIQIETTPCYIITPLP